MKRQKFPKRKSGEEKLRIAGRIHSFIQNIIEAGARDRLGPKATKEMIKQEAHRRLSL